MNEACLAQEVTVIGSEKAFPEEDLEVLRLSGCVVERISGDGMKIASILKER
jgi:hypothetical protein